MSSTEPSRPAPSPDAQGATPGFAPPAAQPTGYEQNPAQPWPGQPYAPSAVPPQGTPYPGQPWAGGPYQGQPYAGQQYPVPPYQGQPSAGQPYAGQPYAGPPSNPQYAQPYPGQPYPPATPVAASAPATENVGRGLLFSLGGIVVGVVITIVLWKLNFIASITSFVMAYATIWLYTKGAGSPPRRGVGGVIAVIVAGVVVSLASVVVVDALDYLAAREPDASLGEKADFVVYNLLQPGVWQGYAGNVAMYVLFAALGTFGLIRQLGRAKGPR